MGVGLENSSSRPQDRERFFEEEND